MAVFSRRSVSLVADHKDAGGGFYDVVGDGLEFVNGEHAFDLRKEALEEAEVAASDALDGGDSLGVGEVVGVECAAEVFPLAVEDEEEFFAGESSVVVGEAEAAVKLRVVTKLLVDAGHTDEAQSLGPWLGTEAIMSSLPSRRRATAPGMNDRIRLMNHQQRLVDMLGEMFGIERIGPDDFLISPDGSAQRAPIRLSASESALAEYSARNAIDGLAALGEVGNDSRGVVAALALLSVHIEEEVGASSEDSISLLRVRNCRLKVEREPSV